MFPTAAAGTTETYRVNIHPLYAVPFHFVYKNMDYMYVYFV